MGGRGAAKCAGQICRPAVPFYGVTGRAEETYNKYKNLVLAYFWSHPCFSCAEQNAQPAARRRLPTKMVGI